MIRIRTEGENRGSRSSTHCKRHTEGEKTFRETALQGL